VGVWQGGRKKPDYPQKKKRDSKEKGSRNESEKSFCRKRTKYIGKGTTTSIKGQKKGERQKTRRGAQKSFAKKKRFDAEKKKEFFRTEGKKTVAPKNMKSNSEAAGGKRKNPWFHEKKGGSFRL